MQYKKLLNNMMVKMKLVSSIVGISLLSIGCARYTPNYAPKEIVFNKRTGLDVSPKKDHTEGLKITYFGNATLLFDDGKDSILFDGFVSRPNLVKALVLPLNPNKKVVRDFIKHKGFENLRVIAVNHTHYDHVLDAPLIAKLTGAEVLGSKLTQEVVKAYEPEVDSNYADPNGRAKVYGQFRIKSIESKHAKYGCSLLDRIGLSHDRVHEDVKVKPLRKPFRLWSLKDGGAYSFHVSHPKVDVFVQASAGFRIGQTKPSHKANIIFFSVALMDKMSYSEREDYWKEIVTKTETTGKRIIIPIHWDNLFRPFKKPLKPSVDRLQDLSSSAEFINYKVSKLTNTEVVWMQSNSSIIIK